MRFQHLSICALLVGLITSQTACLKTRAQLKTEQGQDQQSEGDEGVKGNGPAKPGRYEELEMLKAEVTRVSGKVDELDHHSRSQNFSELKEYLTRVDTRVAELEKNQLLMLYELKALKDRDTAKEQAAREAARPPSDLLTEAHKLLSEKKCEEAADKFRALSGKGVKGKDAAEAHFGLGEANYCLKDYKKAIVQYSKVQEAFAKSPRIPASLYRMGLAFGHLNMSKESKGFFSELLTRYPKSPEAKKAKGKVKE